jgi:hypothetical protein
MSRAPRLAQRFAAWQWLLLGALVAFSLVMWYIFHIGQLTLIYNDAKSYLNISRMVFDSQQPGLAQIGSVWLPLTHLLKLPFIWIDELWRSGFAGSMVSMISYVFTVIGTYAVVMRLAAHRIAAVVAAAVVALNANLLYLQSTPLTEPLYVALLVWSVYFLVRYLQESELKHLLPLALLTGMQIATRYDGWFVAGVTVIILLMHELRVRRLRFSHAAGQTMLLAVPAAFAGLLWVGWNALIFSDPLYFMRGPQSAYAQQSIIAENSGLITEGSASTSFAAYGYAVAGNVGWMVLALGLVGWVAFLLARRRAWRVPVAVVGALGAVFVFNVLALVLGFSTLTMPELERNVSSTVAPLFNVRYGVLMLPLVAIGVGLAAAKWRHMWLLALGLVVWQGVVAFQGVPLTVRDGQVGASAFTQHELADRLGRGVGEGETVLLSLASFNPVAFESGVPLEQIVHEGVRHRWEEALAYPEGSADWIVMSNNESDPVYAHLHGSDALDTHYKRIYHSDRGSLYHRVEPRAP